MSYGGLAPRRGGYYGRKGYYQNETGGDKKDKCNSPDD